MPPRRSRNRAKPRVQRPIRPEVKHIDVAIVPTNITTTPAATWITASITGGYTAATRVGNAIRIKRILIDAWVTNGGASNCVRGLLFSCFNGQQATPTLTAWYLPFDGDAYTSLAERRINISNTTSTAITKPLRISKLFKGQGRLIRFDNSSANSEITPRIMFVTVSDASAAPYPSLEGYIRVYYTDV